MTNPDPVSRPSWVRTSTETTAGSTRAATPATEARGGVEDGGGPAVRGPGADDGAEATGEQRDDDRQPEQQRPPRRAAGGRLEEDGRRAPGRRVGEHGARAAGVREGAGRPAAGTGGRGGCDVRCDVLPGLLRWGPRVVGIPGPPARGARPGLLAVAHRSPSVPCQPGSVPFQPGPVPFQPGPVAVIRVGRATTRLAPVPGRAAAAGPRRQPAAAPRPPRRRPPPARRPSSCTPLRALPTPAAAERPSRRAGTWTRRPLTSCTRHDPGKRVLSRPRVVNTDTVASPSV